MGSTPALTGSFIRDLILDVVSLLCDMKLGGGVMRPKLASNSNVGCIQNNGMTVSQTLQMRASLILVHNAYVTDHYLAETCQVLTPIVSGIIVVRPVIFTGLLVQCEQSMSEQAGK